MASHKKSSKTTIPDWLLKSREGWQHTGQQRPAFAEPTSEGQLSVWDFPRPPALKAVTQKLEVYHEDDRIAETTNGLAILETASPPTYYIPLAAIATNLLAEVPNKNSICEWKGKARYWTLRKDPRTFIAWSYERPFAPFEALKDHMAFYPQQLSCFVDGEKVIPQPGAFYAGWITKNLAGPFKGAPGTAHW